MAIQADPVIATSQVQAPPLGRLDTATQTILVVDDRAINRDFLVSLLKHFGYKLREAESAEQAWGMAVSGGIDLIITDVHMNGMSGFMLLEKLAIPILRAFPPSSIPQPIRILTSNALLKHTSCMQSSLSRQRQKRSSRLFMLRWARV